MTAAVTIMAYEPSPSVLEQASYRQCVTVLRDHPLFLVCPESLNAEWYIDSAAEIGARIACERFDDTFFSGVAAYNNLVKALFFYERFATHEYILIYQLDAWVFRDELLFWCGKGFDCIGAPWYSDGGELLPEAGNGGFSLRKVASFLRLLSGELEKNCSWRYDYVWSELHKLPSLRQWRIWGQAIATLARCRISPSRYVRQETENEDLVFHRVFSFIHPMRIASATDALGFSFERFPEDSFQKNNEKLPFGCHAFAKYNPMFWLHWIPVLRQFLDDNDARDLGCGGRYHPLFCSVGVGCGDQMAVIVGW
jgi:hypothetical protein